MKTMSVLVDRGAVHGLLFMMTRANDDSCKYENTVLVLKFLAACNCSLGGIMVC